MGAAASLDSFNNNYLKHDQLALLLQKLKDCADDACKQAAMETAQQQSQFNTAQMQQCGSAACFEAALQEMRQDMDLLKGSEEYAGLLADNSIGGLTARGFVFGPRSDGGLSNFDLSYAQRALDILAGKPLNRLIPSATCKRTGTRFRRRSKQIIAMS